MIFPLPKMVENELVNAISFVQENNASFVLFKKDN
jgi:hypothetical protein